MTTSTTLALAAGAACLATTARAQPVNFGAPVTYTVPGAGSPYYVAAGDIDNDGDIDLVTDSNGPGNDPTQVWWNDGTGVFSLGPVLTSGWGFGAVAMADIDDDGDLDIVRCNYFSNGAYFFRNNSGTTFDAGWYYSGGGGCQDVVFADLNGDKDMDFVLTDQFGDQVRPYDNVLGLGFNSVGLFATGDEPYAITAGDVDLDKDVDLVTSNESGDSVTVLYNNGTGTFTTGPSYAMGMRPTDVILADLNGDSFPDLVSTDWDALLGVGESVSVRLGTGGGSFGPRVTYATSGFPESVAASDINGDGVLDLVVACNLDDEIVVLEGNGDGTFQPYVGFDAFSDPRQVVLADFDGDGDDDVATVSNFSSRLVVLMNNSGTPVDPDPIQVVWHAGHDNFFNEDIPTHVAVDPSGNIITAGSTYFTSNENDYHLVKFDSDGNELWQATFNGSGDHYDSISGLVIDPDGSAIVTGQSWNGDFGVEWLTVKYLSDGTQAWARTYGAVNTFSQQRPSGLAVGPDGSIAVCGYYIDGSFDAKFAVVLYDQNGTLLWERQLQDGAAYGGWARAIAFDPSGNIVVTGVIDDDDEFGDELYVAKLNAAGDTLWTARFDATTTLSLNETVGFAVRTDSLGNIYIAGDTFTDSSTGYDCVVLKYTPAGALAWSHVVSALGAVTGMAVTLLDDNTVVASGSGGSGVVMAAYTPGGAPLWQTTVAGSTSFDNPAGHIALGADGALYVSGQSGSDIGVFQIAPDGAVLASIDVDSGSASDTNRAITAAHDGSIYALGSYQPEIVNRRDFSLFKLAPATNACPADFDGDGDADGIDVGLFLQAYGTGSPDADLDGDGDTDGIDVGLFLQAYGTGC